MARPDTDLDGSPSEYEHSTPRSAQDEQVGRWLSHFVPIGALVLTHRKTASPSRRWRRIVITYGELYTSDMLVWHASSDRTTLCEKQASSENCQEVCSAQSWRGREIWAGLLPLEDLLGVDRMRMD